ncbi:MAG: PEP-CTERM sorting domain-containing protein [Planctomycetes bacterium]|nr:PEP-CTERM sorting domain-containing protein [Planctomycetota bacterium]
MYNVTTGTNFNFGGNPLANTGIYLRTVPEPASIGLLVVGALALLRRR